MNQRYIVINLISTYVYLATIAIVSIIYVRTAFCRYLVRSAILLLTMPETNGKKKSDKNAQTPSRTASNVAVNANDSESIGEVIRLLTDLIHKVDNSRTTTIEQMTNFVDKVMAERQTVNELKFEQVNNSIYDLNVKCDKLLSENDALKKKGDERDKYIQHLEAQLETANNEADEIQINVNRPYLVVNNFKPVQEKQDEEAFSDFCNTKMADIHVNMTANDIDKLIRIKHKSQSDGRANDKAETMIVKFKQEKHRDILFRNKRKLAGSGTTFTELLPPRRKLLLNKCIQELPIENRSLWTDGGKVLVAYGRGSSNITHIRSPKDIVDLKQKLFHGQQNNPISA